MKERNFSLLEDSRISARIFGVGSLLRRVENGDLQGCRLH